VENSVERALELTALLGECVRNGEWEKALSVELQRKALLARLFESGEVQEAEGFIKEVLARDKDVMAQVAQARSEMAERLRELRQGRTAQKAYSSI